MEKRLYYGTYPVIPYLQKGWILLMFNIYFILSLYPYVIPGLGHATRMPLEQSVPVMVSHTVTLVIACQSCWCNLMTAGDSRISLHEYCRLQKKRILCSDTLGWLLCETLLYRQIQEWWWLSSSAGVERAVIRLVCNVTCLVRWL